VSADYCKILLKCDEAYRAGNGISRAYKQAMKGKTGFAPAGGKFHQSRIKVRHRHEGFWIRFLCFVVAFVVISKAFKPDVSLSWSAL
jgi:hypothetical protein